MLQLVLFQLVEALPLVIEALLDDLSHLPRLLVCKPPQLIGGCRRAVGGLVWFFHLPSHVEEFPQQLAKLRIVADGAKEYFFGNSSRVPPLGVRGFCFLYLVI